PEPREEFLRFRVRAVGHFVADAGALRARAHDARLFRQRQPLSFDELAGFAQLLVEANHEMDVGFHVVGRPRPDSGILPPRSWRVHHHHEFHGLAPLTVGRSRRAVLDIGRKLQLVTFPRPHSKTLILHRMRRALLAAATASVCSLGLVAQSQPAVDPATQTVRQYCVGCHNDRAKAGDLSFSDFDIARVAEHPDVGERMIRKLRASMMPPAGARRPDAATLQALRQSLETRLDRAAAASPNPGWRPFQRLTRAEYAQSVKDLLDVDVDVTAYLPPDTMSQGFDNIADTQAFSPALAHGYLRAASQISRLAVGDRSASATTLTHRVLATENQRQYAE